jgi:hypothetical protein
MMRSSGTYQEGIQERHHIEKMMTIRLPRWALAAKIALERAKISKTICDLTFCHLSPDYYFPGCLGFQSTGC